MSSFLDQLPAMMRAMLEVSRQDEIQTIQQWVSGDTSTVDVLFESMHAVLAMETVDVARVTSLITPQTAIQIMGLAVRAKRLDVMRQVMTVEQDPIKLLDCVDVALDDDAVDALLEHIHHDVLNTRLNHTNRWGVESSIAAWEVWIVKDRGITQERFIDVILPKLHAAGADLMDVRFEEEDDEVIASDEWDIASDYTPGRRALATYRLTSQLHALADEAAPAQPRARARL